MIIRSVYLIQVYLQTEDDWLALVYLLFWHRGDMILFRIGDVNGDAVVTWLVTLWCLFWHCGDMILFRIGDVNGDAVVTWLVTLWCLFWHCGDMILFRIGDVNGDAVVTWLVTLWCLFWHCGESRIGAWLDWWLCCDMIGDFVIVIETTQLLINELN